MYQNIIASLSVVFVIGLFTPSEVKAKQGVFSNQVQLQSLNDLSDIIDDSKSINLRRSSNSIYLTLNRLQTAVQSIQALGNFPITASAQNAYRPYAFIKTSIDRRKLIKSMNMLIPLHQQYRHALNTKNKKQKKKIRRAIFKHYAKINHIKNKWRKKVGKIGGVNKRKLNNGPLSVCRNLLPHEKYYSQWESCCDIANNKSRWLNRASNKVQNWTGSCRKWGIR